jgi:isoleucyl-tRNA synthetase
MTSSRPFSGGVPGHRGDAPLPGGVPRAAEHPREPALPDKPSLDGLEDTWIRRWEEQGTYGFDRAATRDRVYSIDTPPPTVSGVLHVGSAFSYTHTDVAARFQRMPADRTQGAESLRRAV